MTRNEFARAMAYRMREKYPYANITFSDAKIWVSSVFDALTEEVIKEDRITIKDFGTFKKKIRKEKLGYDINTGNKVINPAKVVVCFVPSVALENKVAAEADMTSK